MHVCLNGDTLEEVHRNAFGHVRVAGTLGVDAVWIPKLVDLDAETAQLHRHGSNDCVHVLSSESAGTDATAESEVTSVRKDTTSNASRCGATSPMARCQHDEARYELIDIARRVEL